LKELTCFLSTTRLRFNGEGKGLFTVRMIFRFNWSAMEAFLLRLGTGTGNKAAEHTKCNQKSEYITKLFVLT
jgi:hypothetical protein